MGRLEVRQSVTLTQLFEQESLPFQIPGVELKQAREPLRNQPGNVVTAPEAQILPEMLPAVAGSSNRMAQPAGQGLIGDAIGPQKRCLGA